MPDLLTTIAILEGIVHGVNLVLGLYTAEVQTLPILNVRCGKSTSLIEVLCIGFIPAIDLWILADEIHLSEIYF